MSKISIILFGLLVALAVLASAENEEQSLSEEISSMRVVRDADAGRGKKKNNRKNKRKNKKAKKSKKNKKAKKSKKNRKSKRKNNKKQGKNKKRKSYIKFV